MHIGILVSSGSVRYEIFNYLLLNFFTNSFSYFHQLSEKIVNASHYRQLSVENKMKIDYSFVVPRGLSYLNS